MFKKKYTSILLATIITASIALAGCNTTNSAESSNTTTNQTSTQNTDTENSQSTENAADNSTTKSTTGSSILDTSDMFTERDLTQTPDLTDATTYTVKDGEDITINKEGVYVLQGSAENVTVYIEAEDTEKVQIVLDGVSITNSDTPCIYVQTADKVFVTTTSDSTLKVTDTFKEDDNNATATIFSKETLVLNGTASLTIESTDTGVDSKDDLKVTGGTYQITATKKALEANDSIRINDGEFHLEAGTDGLHAENTDDDSLGYVYIAGGTFEINSGDDGIHGNSVVHIDGGTFNINAGEAIEGTYVQLNGGTVEINASDDGINAANKSSAYSPTIEITGGEYNITMAAGDTDALDANGDLIISGGTVNINAQFAFDFDGSASLTGGTVTVNGENVTEITNSMMMGGNQGGNPGDGNFGGKGNQMPDGTAPENGSKPDGTPSEKGSRPDGNMGPGGNQSGAPGTITDDTNQSDTTL